jgi:polyisoprenoid-binding protein YceI
MMWMLAVALGAFALLPASALAEEYRIQAAQSEVVVLVFKAGFASALAHDHVVRATQITGFIRGESNRPATADIQVTVPAATLVPDEPPLRKRHGLPGELGDSDRQKIQSTMLGETQLHAAAHPDIRFRSTSVEPRGPADFLVAGDFTLHGITRRIQVSVTAHLAGGSLRATGAFDLNQSDFGIAPISLFLGAVRTQDRVRVVFDLVATP